MARTVNLTTTQDTYHDYDSFIEAVTKIENDETRDLVSARHLDGSVFETICEQGGMYFGLGEADDQDIANWVYPDELTSVSLRVIRESSDRVSGPYVNYLPDNKLEGIDSWYYPSIGASSDLYAIDYTFTVEGDDTKYEGRIYPNGE